MFLDQVRKRCIGMARGFVVLDENLYELKDSLEKQNKKTMVLVTAFINLNKAALLSYWKGKIDTAELTSQLKPVSGS